MSKSGKSGKSKAKSSIYSDSGPILFVMGHVDLIFTLNLTDKDLEKPKEENSNEEQKENKEDKYYKLEDLTSIQSLKFIKDKKEIWDKIAVSGANDTLSQLIIGNKTSKKKVKIDYIGYGRPKFEGDDEFFDEIFDYVTAKKHLIINKTPLDEGGRYSLTIILKHNGKTQTISEGKSQEEEDKENKKKKKNSKKNQKNEQKDKNKQKKKKKKDKEAEEEEEEDEDSEDEGGDDDEDDEEKEEEDYEETEAMKDKKIPKFKRSSSVLVKLNPTFSRYDMIYINYVDIKKIPGDFKMKDLLELIKFFKNKGSTLFVNFYKPKKPKVQEEPEEPEEDREQDNKIMDEGKTKNEPEEEKEEPEEKKEEEENKKDNQDKPPKKLLELNQLFEYTNIFFFDVKQCQKMFNKHYNTFTEDNINNRKKINNRNKVIDYFIKGVATATKEEVTGMKTGLFMDQLNKFIIIFASKKAANKQEFDSQPHPKVNHSNIALVDEYRKILKANKNDYYSILISNIVMNCAAYSSCCQSTEVIYPAFLISLEIIKKKLECQKNDLEQNKNIYKVKISEKTILKNLEKISADGKEDGFVLDCMNKQKSSFKDYVSLYDYHLKSHFTSENVRKDLKSKVFINSKGFIMYDPVHRGVMGIRTEKKKKKLTEEQMKNQLMDSIHGIDVPGNIKDKEIDAKKKAKTQNTPTDTKLPVNKDAVPINAHKKKRRRKHKKSKKGEGSSGGGSSEEYSSGNNSGMYSGNDDSFGTGTGE